MAGSKMGYNGLKYSANVLNEYFETLPAYPGDRVMRFGLYVPNCHHTLYPFCIAASLTDWTVKEAPPVYMVW
ncbi:MAG: hypothetical protein NTU85_03680, partial [Candidatus Kaiserbacteria bacterium]|nr:hypothetical protein [Candidatus Kaiserbacteria bacterium]